MDTKLAALLDRGVDTVEEIEQQLLLMRRIYHTSASRVDELVDVDLSDVEFTDIEFVDFFRHDAALTDEVRAYLAEKDSFWQNPSDTGFCSSNCMINDAGIALHLKERSYHNYGIPLAWDRRLGIIDSKEFSD